MFGWRGKIGIIVPSNNTIIEPELNQILPDGVSVYASRIFIEGVSGNQYSIIEMERNAEKSAETLSAANIDVIIYCCLSTSLIKGENWDREFRIKMSKKAGCPVITAFHAAVKTLKEEGISKVGIVSPYPEEIHRLIAPAFKKKGIQVVSEENSPVNNIYKISEMNLYKVYNMIVRSDSKIADGIYILSTDLPTFRVIQAAENDLGKPVISTNQAILHAAFKVLGLNCHIPGYGKLLNS